MPLAFPPQVPDWVSLPNAWDTITIAGVPWGKSTPVGGKIVVKGATRFYKIDQKDAKGQDGSTQTYVGTHPKPFKIHFGIWTSLQWAYFNSAILPLFYYSGVIGKVLPLSILSPWTAVVGIGTIITETIGPCDINEQTKEGVFTIEVREYLPALPGNASVTPIATNAGASATPVGYLPSGIVALKTAQATVLAQLAAGPSNFPPNR